MSAKPSVVTVPNDNPTVVVVDTNAFHQGRLTRSSIKSLRTLTDLGLHVIVPDVVCRELASHAWQDYLQAEELLALSGLDTSGLDQPYKIYDNFKESIEATGATLAASPHGYFLQGIHAQILRAAPASPKGDVTTGAVDYIVFLHATAATDRYSRVAVITSDKVLRTALASRPGIQVFPDFSSVRKGDVSHMRLPLQEALASVKHLLSDDFQRDMAAKVDPTSSGALTVVGIGDILRINDKQIAAYVDVSVPSFTGEGGDYFGNDVERWQVTLDEASFTIDRNTLIATDPFAVWPPHITPVDEYLSTELSMVPSIFRPVPYRDFMSNEKTPITFKESDTGDISFLVGETPVAELRHSEYTVTREHHHEEDLFVEKSQQTEIFLQTAGARSTRLAKGSLAVVLMSKAVELLS